MLLRLASELPCASPLELHALASAVYFVALALPLAAWWLLASEPPAVPRSFARACLAFAGRLAALAVFAPAAVVPAKWFLRYAAAPAFLSLFGLLPPPGLFAALALGCVVALARVGPDALWDFLKRRG